MNDLERKKFIKHLENDDELQIIIRTHLYIESQFASFLKRALINHKVLNLNKMSYHNKLNLCVALGLFDEAHSSSYREYNTLRNKIAHNLDYKVSQKDLISVKKAAAEWEGLSGVVNEFKLIDGNNSLINDLKVLSASLFVFLRGLVEERKRDY
ncbi:hypothetical protein RYX56_12505 [Alkalihalophilus lindianensis]|uniref:Mannitol repressor n=1 Tax=Alkalihalophilus lindianensis TaxID=1630542 RepID=A0ABU3XBB0_9BACI|nr:hypothetical protein [Alkalihalophilus lindianensis]MDV2685177.1 hypothetical protein [Alkalihalophilus lindianensis]